MTDLMYFGHEWDDGGKELETTFIDEIKETFPDVVLKDAYDSIKGYRQEVHILKDKEEDYKIWLLAFGWFNCSLTTQLEMMQDSEHFKLLINKAKEKYPRRFKERKEK